MQAMGRANIPAALRGFAIDPMDFTFANTYSILIVDRDSSGLRFVESIVRGTVHCDVECQVDALSAFEHGLCRSFDLFIFDHSLPEISGPLLYRLLARVYEREQPLPAPIPPVIYLCDESERVTVQKLASEPGVRGVISRPVSVQRLAELVRAALPKDARRDESAIIS